VWCLSVQGDAKRILIGRETQPTGLGSGWLREKPTSPLSRLRRRPAAHRTLPQEMFRRWRGSCAHALLHGRKIVQPFGNVAIVPWGAELALIEDAIRVSLELSAPKL